MNKLFEKLLIDACDEIDENNKMTLNDLYNYITNYIDNYNQERLTANTKAYFDTFVDYGITNKR